MEEGAIGSSDSLGVGTSVASAVAPPKIAGDCIVSVLGGAEEGGLRTVEAVRPLLLGLIASNSRAEVQRQNICYSFTRFKKSNR